MACVRRTYTEGDIWELAKRMKNFTFDSRDVGHTGCCKPDSIATLFYFKDADCKPRARRDLEPHVKALRAVLAAALDQDTFAILKAVAPNRSDYRQAVDLEDARLRCFSSSLPPLIEATLFLDASTPGFLHPS